jgi:hypothetical protein
MRKPPQGSPRPTRETYVEGLLPSLDDVDDVDVDGWSLPNRSSRAARPASVARMRRALALVQLLGLATALAAMLAPAPRTLLEKWSSFTIYPWWTLVLFGVGAGAAAVSVAAPAGATRVLAATAGVTGVLAAQVGALGVWAQKHWLPAFGFGGGYAGDVDELEQLAWIVAGAGILASLAAVGQLLVQHDWPRPVASVTRWRRAGSGVAVLVGLPILLAGADPDLADLTSVVAMALIYGIPWGVSLAGAGWLSRHGALGVLAGCFISATLSAVAPSNQITGDEARAALAGVAVLFGVLLVVELRQADQLAARRQGAPAPP